MPIRPPRSGPVQMESFKGLFSNTANGNQVAFQRKYRNVRHVSLTFSLYPEPGSYLYFNVYADGETVYQDSYDESGFHTLQFDTDRWEMGVNASGGAGCQVRYAGTVTFFTAATG